MILILAHCEAQGSDEGGPREKQGMGCSTRGSHEWTEQEPSESHLNDCVHFRQYVNPKGAFQ